MPLGILFWILMIFWLVFGIFRIYSKDWWLGGGSLFLFVLFAIIGWKLFGPVIQGG
jgi:hypothetical protein